MDSDSSSDPENEMRESEEEDSDAENEMRESEEGEEDSDAELQVALMKGLIKPGLVGKKPTEKTFINDKAGLAQALAEFQKNLPWIERVDLTLEPVPPPKAMSEQLGEKPDDLSTEFNNDFKREMKFYRQAQAAVMTGIKKLQKLGVPTKRPADYFAEMVKTDDHMEKVREKLLSKQSAIDKRGQKKRRKYNNDVQKEVLQKKQNEKKELAQAVKKFRKGKKDSLDFLDDKKKSNNKKRKNAPGAKRQAKDKKFGFGGQKKRRKYNNDGAFNKSKAKKGKKFGGK